MSEYAGNHITARQVWIWSYVQLTGFQMFRISSDIVSAHDSASEARYCVQPYVRHKDGSTMRTSNAETL